MSDAEKDKIIEIATDPRFGVPELADDLSSDYPELEVDRISGAGAPPGTIDTMATGNRAYVTLNWKVAGVQYASVTTEANFDNSGAKVTRVNNCWGSSSNFLPGIRTVEGNSYHSLSGGILTCKTDWTAKFIVGNDRRTTQGLQVTGNRTFLDQWPKGQLERLICRDGRGLFRTWSTRGRAAGNFHPRRLFDYRIRGVPKS